MPPPNATMTSPRSMPLASSVSQTFSSVAKLLIASPAGSEISLKANCEVDGQDPKSRRLLVAVTDSGGGIAPQDQPRVFDRFYRAEKALIAGLGETGVGMSIIKALVEAHQGQVWVESEMGRGSTFVFALPFITAEKQNSTKSTLLSRLGGNQEA